VARSAAEEAAAGVWGRSPQRGPGAEPLVGARGRSPRIFLKTIGVLVPLRAILAIEGPTKLMLKFPEITIYGYFIFINSLNLKSPPQAIFLRFCHFYRIWSTFPAIGQNLGGATKLWEVRIFFWKLLFLCYI